MHSTTRLAVAVDATGTSRVGALRCEVPQLVRVTHGADVDADVAQIHLVGGAAGPLGGDVWNVRLDLAARSRVRLRSVAASLAQPDPHGRPSTAVVQVRLDDAATLDAWPEPIVSVQGSHHTLEVTLDVGADTSLRWVDEVVLGRHGEPPGTVVLRQRLTQCGEVRVMSEMHLGQGAAGGSFGGHGPFRVVATAVGSFDGPSAVEVCDAGRAVRCDLGGGWATWSAVGHGHATVRRLLAALGLER